MSGHPTVNPAPLDSAGCFPPSIFDGSTVIYLSPNCPQHCP